MDLKTAMVVAVFFAAIAWLTAIASTPVGHPDKEAAVAAALRENLGQGFGKDFLTKGDELLPKLVLCLESEVFLDIDSVARNLSNTIVTPVPIAACSSKTVEGDFGMFTAMTNYFGPVGEAAAHLKVVGVSCSTVASCVVDVDSRGRGERYRVERLGQSWKVADSRLRWVV